MENYGTKTCRNLNIEIIAGRKHTHLPLIIAGGNHNFDKDRIEIISNVLEKVFEMKKKDFISLMSIFKQKKKNYIPSVITFLYSNFVDIKKLYYEKKFCNADASRIDSDQPAYILPYFFGYNTHFFPFQNNTKDLDPSCKMDLDLWDCLGRGKLVL